MHVSQYTKTIVGLVVAGLIALQQALDGGSLLFVILSVVIAIAAAAATAAFGNTETGVMRYLALIIHVAGVVAQAILAVVGTTLGFSDVSYAQWITVVLQALAATGVVSLPNSKAATPTSTTP